MRYEHNKRIEVGHSSSRPSVSSRGRILDSSATQLPQAWGRTSEAMGNAIVEDLGGGVKKTFNATRRIALEGFYARDHTCAP